MDYYDVQSAISIFGMIIAFVYLGIYNYEKAYDKQVKFNYKRIFFIVIIIFFVVIELTKKQL